MLQINFALKITVSAVNGTAEKPPLDQVYYNVNNARIYALLKGQNA